MHKVKEVTLTEMLAARDARAARQMEILAAHGLPIVSFSLNIPGPIKDSPLIRRTFRAGTEELAAALAAAKMRVAFQEEKLAATGCEALFAVDGDPKSIKRICVGIEDASQLGRLFDLDVLDSDGRSLSREDDGGSPRTCLVCGASGRGCASRRLHGVRELQQAAGRIMEEHFRMADREKVAFLATKSLLDEACTTPKPGLVDCANSGSHRDMDRFTLMASAAALHTYWGDAMMIGQETAGESHAAAFDALRRRGQAAERCMFAATRGINTHKGAIFTLGTLCGAIGRLWKADAPCRDSGRLLAECALLSSAAVKSDLSSLAAGNMLSRTAGERLYMECGLTGSRGELAAGLPSVRETALPVLRTALENGRSRNDAGAIALLYLIAEGKDTNMVARGGQHVAEGAARQVRNLLRETPLPSMEQIEEIDRCFIRLNLSPGGCADLLAAACFLLDWESIESK